MKPAIEPTLAETAEWVRQRWSGKPQFGIVLGTGSGEVAKSIESDVTFLYKDIPGFPVSTSVGHAGNLVCGKLSGVDVVAMQGRFHLYEGHSVESATKGIQLFGALGAKSLVVTNAAGGINPQYVSGDIMLIDSHLDLMFRRAQPHATWDWKRSPQIRSDSAYDRKLMKVCERTAGEHDFRLFRGTYVGMLGPNYETRAEYRALRKLGGDTVGMSTIPEVCLAASLGMRIIGFSVVTNVADPDNLVPTTGEDVVAFADIAAPRLKILIQAIICS